MVGRVCLSREGTIQPHLHGRKKGEHDHAKHDDNSTALAPSSSAVHSSRGRMWRKKSGSYSAGWRATSTASILKG